MQKKYIIRNIYGGFYTYSRDQSYPYIDSEDSHNVTIYDSEQDDLNDIEIILSSYTSHETPLIELVPIYTH
jgi:hypothetical protein